MLEILIIKGPVDQKPNFLKGVLGEKEYPIVVTEKYENTYVYYFKVNNMESWERCWVSYSPAHSYKRKPIEKERKAITKDFALWRMDVK